MPKNDPKIFNVRSVDFGLSEIGSYIPKFDTRRLETLRAQQRLSRAWLMKRKELHERIYRDPEELSRWKLEKISHLVNNAYATNQFYHKLYKSVGFRSGDILDWKDYEALPSINKNDIIENFDLFTASNALGKREYYVSRTSGSSGNILTRYQDEAFTDHKMLLYYRYWEQVLGRERQQEEWLYRIYFQHAAFTSILGSFPSFTLSLDCPPEIAAKHIKLMKPAVLTTFPSYLFRMLDFPIDVTELGISAIVTQSESSTVGEREAIAQRFGVPVYDQYSTEELSFIAAECHMHKYHVIEDNVHVGVLDPDSNGLGEIVVTGFMNTFLPFIRYRHGDLIQLGSEYGECPCGSRFRTIARFLGRADQCLRKRNDGIVSPDLVMSLYDRILIPRKARIGEFHILQDSIDRIDFFAKGIEGAADGPDLEVLRLFADGLKELFGDTTLEVKIHIVTELPPTLSRKRRLITSTLGKSAST